MKIYLALPKFSDIKWAIRGLEDRNPNMLISYWYYRTDEQMRTLFAYANPQKHGYFADCGAFTAHKKNVTISVEMYGEWLKKHHHQFDVYANLDVQLDIPQSRHNQSYLESQGLRPMPVYHLGEPWDFLESLLEDYPYIAIGGVAGKAFSARQRMAALARCFRLAEGAGGAKKTVYHGFGMTDWTTIRSFPWYSVDSSSWSRGCRFGSVPVFQGQTGQMTRISIDRPDALPTAVREYLFRNGFNPMDIIDRSRYNGRFPGHEKKKFGWAQAAQLGTFAFLEAETWLTRYFNVTEIPKRGKWADG